MSKRHHVIAKLIFFISTYIMLAILHGLTIEKSATVYMYNLL